MPRRSYGIREVIFALLILASHKLRRMEFYRRREHRSALIASRFPLSAATFSNGSLRPQSMPAISLVIANICSPLHEFLICRAGKSWSISHKCLLKPLNKPLILHLVNHDVSVNDERVEYELKRISLMYWQMLFYKRG